MNRDIDDLKGLWRTNKMIDVRVKGGWKVEAIEMNE